MADKAMSLGGKRVVIIGGATGIGFAIAELAGGLGASIVIGSTNAARVDSAAERLPDAIGRTVDLRIENSVAGFFEDVGAFDHLAITAGDWGGPMFASIRDLDLLLARDLLSVRLWGVLAAIKNGCSTIAQDGSITLTGGMLAHRPGKGTPLATAMAGAIEHLTCGLAVDLAPVRVNAVCPGLILTDYVKQMPEEMRQSMVARQPLPRCATPEEAAMAYIYLMLNGYVTGQTLPIDGGGMVV